MRLMAGVYVAVLLALLVGSVFGYWPFPALLAHTLAAMVAAGVGVWCGRWDGARTQICQNHRTMQHTHPTPMTPEPQPLSPPTPPAAPLAPLWSNLPHAPAPGTPLAHRDDLADGVPTMLALDTGGGADKPFRLLLLRSGADVRAFVNRCAHFGVPLAAKQAQLIFKPHTSITCNVHYARYRWADGTCESGECEGEGLVAVPLQIDAVGQICIAPGGGTAA